MIDSPLIVKVGKWCIGGLAVGFLKTGQQE